MSSYYRLDRTKIPKRDPEAEMESRREYGFFQHAVFKELPLEAVKPEPVWNPAKLARVLRDIEQGKALAPIQVVKKGGRYEVTDGIHRLAASLQLGFSHIPALEWVTVQTPEDFVPLQDKMPLNPGTFVLLGDPKGVGASSPLAIVVKHLHSSTRRGGITHQYNLAGFEDGEPWYLGDIFDQEFEPYTGSTGGEEFRLLKEFAV